ncbi:MAG: UDP-N-acetylhexosamine pyrophosphorylase [Phycisphaerales bacterium]|nr:MAG: UDP-N-acetylhexosamine pyrophosphorylase [Phycisphaerales bacterium]
MTGPSQQTTRPDSTSAPSSASTGGHANGRTGPTLESLRPAIESAGQGHLLAFAHELDDRQRSAFAQQLAAIDWAALPQIIERHRHPTPAEALDGLVEPVVCSPSGPGIRVPAGDVGFDAAQAVRAGLDLIAQGKVAALTVAGGQGTRLGFDGPKGTLPIAPVTGRTLFEIFADQIAQASRWAGRPIPWLIMTSPLNHEQTLDFFRQRQWLGLEQGQVRLFTQGVMPSFCPATGRLLLADKGQLATNPDGHGGVVRALVRSGLLEQLADQGVEHLSYFQVDNPLVPPLDPLFLGAHAGAGGAPSSGQFSSKMVPKADAHEKVGVFARKAGKTIVVEYSDLPEDLAQARNADGRLRFEAGSVAIHAVSLAFLAQVDAAGEQALPFHRAFKKVPHLDDQGRLVEPSEPNAVKLERFVFDALPVADQPLVLRVERRRQFAPTKNATGPDSVQSAKQMQSQRAALWLQDRNLPVPEGCTLELSGAAAWADAAGLPYEPAQTPRPNGSAII